MIKSGEKVGEYLLVEKIGSGAFGDVWKAEKRTALDSNHFALKFFRPKKDNLIDLEKIIGELQVWKKLRGLPHIITVIELDKIDDYVYVVSDFADGGSLETYLNSNDDKPLPESESVEIILDILTGLENIHSKNIIHRDLKPDNILLMNGKYCLADFGVSRELKSQSKATDAAGTMEYMPPEAFGNKFSVQTDIWAVGVILQRLLTGRLPFEQENQAALIGAILQFAPAEMPNSITKELREIVFKCLQKNLNLRFSNAAEMKSIVQNFHKKLLPEIKSGLMFSNKQDEMVILDTQEAPTEVLPIKDLIETQSLVVTQPAVETFSNTRQDTLPSEWVENDKTKTPEKVEPQAKLLLNKIPESTNSKMFLKWLAAVFLGLVALAVGGIAFIIFKSNSQSISNINNLTKNTENTNLNPNTSTNDSPQTQVVETPSNSSSNVDNPVASKEGNMIPSPTLTSSKETVSKTSPSPKTTVTPTPAIVQITETPIKSEPGKSPVNGTSDGLGRRNGRGVGSGGGVGDLPEAPEPKQTPNGGVTQSLKILSKPRPNYTEAAKQNNIQGAVNLRVTFNADGSIGAIFVISGLPYGLTETAIAAARNIRFEPKKVNGVSVSDTKQITFGFTLP